MAASAISDLNPYSCVMHDVAQNLILVQSDIPERRVYRERAEQQVSTEPWQTINYLRQLQPSCHSSCGNLCPSNSARSHRPRCRLTFERHHGVSICFKNTWITASARPRRSHRPLDLTATTCLKGLFANRYPTSYRTERALSLSIHPSCLFAPAYRWPGGLVVVR